MGVNPFLPTGTRVQLEGRRGTIVGHERNFVSESGVRLHGVYHEILWDGDESAGTWNVYQDGEPGNIVPLSAVECLAELLRGDP